MTIRSVLGRLSRDDAASPRPGRVRFGSLRRLTPLSRRWGKDRGDRPIDRYYIERFLSANVSCIRGHVLEVGDDRYTRQFGGDAVARGDVLHVVPGTPGATIIADLTRADHLPSDGFDCVIATQVLQCIEDAAAAVRTLSRIVSPGGAVLATMPGISQISPWDMERWGEYWRFTSLSARRLFAPAFGDPNVEIGSYGNVLAATAFLYGLAAEELCSSELDYHDADYPVTITVRATRRDG